MHIADVEKGNLGATGIVGGNIPVATGAGLAQQMQGTGRVVLCFFGDGASQHRQLSRVAEHGRRCGNCRWSISSRTTCTACRCRSNTAAKLDIADRACAYDMPGEVVDGMDVLAVREAVGRAVERARQRRGPVPDRVPDLPLVRPLALRSAQAYRTKEEERSGRPRSDPQLCQAGWWRGPLRPRRRSTPWRPAGGAGHRRRPSSPSTRPCRPPRSWRTSSTRLQVDGGDYEASASCASGAAGGAGTRKIRYWEALVRDALREEMLRDPPCSSWARTSACTAAPMARRAACSRSSAAERVRDTPISEATIGGAAVGAAMAGMRPVAEIMYVDFTPLAMDQIANQGAKNRYMFGGKTIVPMVIRTEGGAGRSIAAHHSQSLEALWTHFPRHLCGHAQHAL
jgi:2-oxoisovalerate dehydrogenase E1 component